MQKHRGRFLRHQASLAQNRGEKIPILKTDAPHVKTRSSRFGTGKQTRPHFFHFPYQTKLPTNQSYSFNRFQNTISAWGSHLKMPLSPGKIKNSPPPPPASSPKKKCGPIRWLWKGIHKHLHTTLTHRCTTITVIIALNRHVGDTVL